MAKVITSANLQFGPQNHYYLGDRVGLSEKVMKEFLQQLTQVTLKIEIDTETGETMILGINGESLAEPIRG